jgi:hypothetical protein
MAYNVFGDKESVSTPVNNGQSAETLYVYNKKDRRQIPLPIKTASISGDTSNMTHLVASLVQQMLRDFKPKPATTV